MNVLVKSAEVVRHLLCVFGGCCFSTPLERTLKENPYLRFYT